MPPRIRATFYEAIIQYGVTGKEPTLPKSISGYWPIIQPVLDTSHKRYDAAKKRNKSSENNGFATYKEKEKEKEETGKTEIVETEDTELSLLKKQINQNSCGAGVALFGYVDSEFTRTDLSFYLEFHH